VVTKTKEGAIPERKITVGDRAVYKAMGLAAGILGKSLSALERIAHSASTTRPTQNKVLAKLQDDAEKVGDYCHDYSGPMLWLAQYILGTKAEINITAESRYYNDWLETVDDALKYETRKYVEKRSYLWELYPEHNSNKGSLTPIAEMLLLDGVLYGGSPSRSGGLDHMIGYATVTLEGSTLRSVDRFDFEKRPNLIGMPQGTHLLLRAASLLSPHLASNVSHGRSNCCMLDQYFHTMGGNEFLTTIEGPVTDLNRFGWKFSSSPTRCSEYE